jgi:Protein of unknown function (DUF2586)
MGLPTIIFQEGQNGLGRPLPNNDHISALLFYTGGALPTGLATTSIATRCKALYSPGDAVNAGILKDFSDATAATGTYTFTAVGASGDIIEIKVADIALANGNAQVTSLGAYTRLSTDTTVTILAASYAAFINAGTSTHGYSATSSVGALTITAPKRLGAYLNGLTSISATIIGTITGTIVQFTGGVASRWIQYYYQISEFFREQPKGKLWIGFFAVPGTFTFSEVTDMQNNAIGEIRKIGVYKDAVWSTADITALNTICNTNKTLYQPLQVLYAGNLQATTDITTIADVSTLNSNNVQTVLGQDGGGFGNFIYKMNGTAGIKSITCLGAQLGRWSNKKVSESIAWVAQGNLSNGSELEIPAFCNGQLVSSLSANALEALNTKRHIFLKKFTGYSGTFFNDSHMCTTQSSDYAYGENNETICKAERLLYISYLPYLNSPIRFNANGTLDDTTIASFEGVGNTALDQMIRDGELSAKSVTINPTQNVLQTSQLVIAVTLVINGVARTIVIPIGFKPSIA